MTDNELLLAISGLLDKKIKPVEERLDRLEEKVDRLDRRVGKVEERLDKLDMRVGQLEMRVGRLEERFDKLEERFDKLEVRVDQLEKDLAEIKYNQEKVIIPRLNTIEACYTGTWHDSAMLSSGLAPYSGIKTKSLMNASIQRLFVFIPLHGFKIEKLMKVLE